VTGALGASAVITGGLALSAHASQHDEQTRKGVTHEELVAARDKVANLALASDILLAGTALAAGVSVYLTFRPVHAPESATSLVVAPGSIMLRRTF
jgi:hypothetical protein